MANARQYAVADALCFMDGDFLALLSLDQLNMIKILLVEADFKWLHATDDALVDARRHFGNGNDSDDIDDIIITKDPDGLVVASWMEDGEEVGFRSIVSIEIPQNIHSDYIYVRYTI